MRTPRSARRTLLLGAGTLATLAAVAGCTAVGGSETGAADTGATDTSETDTSDTDTNPDDDTDAVAASTDLSIVTVPDALAADVAYDAGETDPDALDDATDVALSGTSATSDSDAVTVAVAVADGTVTIGAAGVYRLTGDLDGQVVIDTEDSGAVTLILDGVTITSATTSAIAFMNADEAVVVLADGTANSLTDAQTYVYPDAETDEPNAALFSTADLTIGGTGSLTVTGQANDGIGSKDGLVITGGDLTVTAVDDGIRGKDHLVIVGGTVDVSAEDDGLKADNDTDDGTGYILLDGGDVTVAAGDDAVKGEQQVLIAGGSLEVVSSEEGIEAEVIIIDGGDVTVTAADDAINASAISTSDPAADETLRIVINGGTLALESEGDGLDSNGSLTVTGGIITVDGTTRGGDGALDSAGTFEVSGGTIVAVGSSGMAQSPSTDSAQAWIAASFDAQAAGSTVTVTDSGGTVIGEYTAAKTYSSLVYTDAAIVAGEQYTISVDGVEVTTVTTGEAIAGGMGGGGMGGGGGTGGGMPGGGGGFPDAGSTDDTTTES